MSANLDRRGFLEVAGGVAAGFVASGRTRAEAAAAKPVQPTVSRIGLQLYTVRDQVATDIEKAIETVAKVGYRVVEFAGYGGRTPEQIRAVLDRNRMIAPSTHIALAELRKDLEAQAHIAEVLGHQYITVPSPGNEMPTTADGWKKFADEFNAIGARLKPRKIMLGFHSHRDEFMDAGGGKKGMDIFVSSTDPNLVAFEIDLGWARVAGENPADWFARYPGRFKMWHVKDIAALATAQENQRDAFKNITARAGQPPAPAPAPAPAPPAVAGPAGGRGGFVTGGPVPVGAGEIDYKPIFPLWKNSGLEYFFVEQDSGPTWPGGSTVAIMTSYRNLVSLLS